jgi:peroxiredoxin Q/BCP
MGLLQSIGLANENTQLSVGSRAPQISAFDDQGAKVDLDDVFAKGFTLIYFYPKALTPVCTSQACEFRDRTKVLQEKEIRIFGVSRDRPENLRRFKEKHQLNFPLLSDQDGRLCKAFGVPIIFSVSLRQSFLIHQGVVVWRDLHPRVGEQVNAILAVVENLKAVASAKE